MKKIDYENFNYDEYYEEIKSEMKKPNIFICGASQIGKSSLINDLLNLPDSNKALVGGSGEATTRKIHVYSSEDGAINLYDSEGYEVGEEKQKYYREEILSFIEKQRERYPDDMTKHIHEVWYCVSAANKKYFELDQQIVNEIVDQGIPLIIILTKVDCISEEELEELKSAIREGSPRVPMFTYSIELKVGVNDITEEIYNKYVQKDEIVAWAIDNLEEMMQGNLLNVVKGSLKEKKKYVLRSLLPKYVALAAGIVTASSFVPVPFSDSVPLMGLQVKMTMDIFKLYGMEHVEKKFITSVIQTQLVSYLGKTLATQIFLAIPYFGNMARAVVNVGTASTITAIIGAAITCITEKYLEECVRANGKDNIEFMEFFTKERLANAIEWVKENDDLGIDAGYTISGIAEKVVNKVKRS